MFKSLIALSCALWIHSGLAQTKPLCSKQNQGTIFVWFYDKKEDSFYATNYPRDIGQYDDVKDDSFGQLAFTLNEQAGDSVRALATFVRKKDGFKKTYKLTGEVKRPTGCPNAVGIVQWNNQEYGDYNTLPPKYKDALARFQKKTSGE